MEQPKPGKRYVSINGEDIPLSSIPEEEWKKMARILKDRFMREVGMVPVNKDE